VRPVLPAELSDDLPIDRAVRGGHAADRLGYAFAAGYGAALSALVPGVPPHTSLCATEEGGAQVVKVDPRAPGVTLTEMPPPPFALEIGHAEVRLDTMVSPEAVLPGDGYDAYLKPFRTVEDVHVHGARLGWMLGLEIAGKARAARLDAAWRAASTPVL